MASVVNLQIDQGSDWAVGFPIKDANGADANLQGWSARGQVRPMVSSSVVLFEWTTANSTHGIITLSSGLLQLSVTAAQSAAFTWRAGVFDVELISPQGKVFRPIRGTVWVDREVTR